MSDYIRWAEAIVKSDSALIISLLIALIFVVRQYLKIKKEKNQIYERHIKLLWEQSGLTRMLMGVVIGDKLHQKANPKKKTKKTRRKKRPSAE